jgi:hypothetical protein
LYHKLSRCADCWEAQKFDDGRGLVKRKSRGNAKGEWIFGERAQPSKDIVKEE